jgi:hypothetical protein
MKLLLASLVATVGVLLVASPATVSAQTTIPGRPNEFTLSGGGTFACDVAGSRCQVTGDFSTVTYGGGRITNLLSGPQWTVLITSDVMTVGFCRTTDDCSVTCNYGCTCTQTDDGAECPFVVATQAPSQAPSKASVSGDDDSGTGSWQSSTGLALVMASIVSAFVVGL